MRLVRLVVFRQLPGVLDVMALYSVRWYDPARQAPVKRDFHTKAAANSFRDRLPFLSEPPKRYSDHATR